MIPGLLLLLAPRQAPLRRLAALGPMATQEQARVALEATLGALEPSLRALEPSLRALGQMSSWRVATVLLSVYTRAILI
jgi:hypothetical protein